MSYIPSLDSLLSTANSTSATLSAAGVFTGTAEETTDFTTVTLNLYSDVASAVDGIQVQFSTDGSNWDVIHYHTLQGNVGVEFSHNVTAKYFRLVYTNGSTIQTAFRVQVIFHAEPNLLQKNNNVSIVNSTVIPLSASSVFTGKGEDVSNYASATVMIFCDEAGVIAFETSMDNVNFDLIRIHICEASIAHEFVIPLTAKYYRTVYTNGIDTQSLFRLQTIFSYEDISQPVISVTGHIDSDALVSTTRSVLTGEDLSGTFRNVGVDANRALSVNIQGPLSAFGEISTIESTPVIQESFIYNINTDAINTATSGGGTVSQSASLASISTSASTSATAEMATKRYLKYRPGQGSDTRFTTIFTEGVSGSFQRAGVGIIGTDGYFFAYEEDIFGILRINNTVDNFTAQTDWNVDVMDGSLSETNPSGILLDPTMGNVYQIAFQWLGFGGIVYSIENPVTGKILPVHIEQYANNFTTPSVRNPAFPIVFAVENTTASTNTVIKTSSCAGFIEGKIAYLGPKNTIENTKAGVTTTLTNIVTLRNKSTYQTLTNQVPIILSALSAAIDGAKPGIIKIVLNTTLGGTPAYNDISTNTSVIEYDIAGTTLTGGTTLATFTLGKVDGLFEKLQELDIVLFPGDTLTFAAAATSSTTDVTVAPIWIEDF